MAQATSELGSRIAAAESGTAATCGHTSAASCVQCCSTAQLCNMQTTPTMCDYIVDPGMDQFAKGMTAANMFVYTQGRADLPVGSSRPHHVVHQEVHTRAWCVPGAVEPTEAVSHGIHGPQQVAAKAKPAAVSSTQFRRRPQYHSNQVEPETRNAYFILCVALLHTWPAAGHCGSQTCSRVKHARGFRRCLQLSNQVEPATRNVRFILCFALLPAKHNIDARPSCEQKQIEHKQLCSHDGSG
jgi:hypothetical protein